MHQPFRRIRSEELHKYLYVNTNIKCHAYHLHAWTMCLNELQPGSTMQVGAAAVKAFERSLHAKNVDLLYVKICITRNTSGHSFVSGMDKFGMYLVFNEGQGGKPFTRNSASQNYRQAKLWLLEMFPSTKSISRLDCLN